MIFFMNIIRDELILRLANTLNITFVVVTHELASIFAIANNSVFLDPETRTMLATGDPHVMLEESDEFKIQNFLRRGIAEE